MSNSPTPTPALRSAIDSAIARYFTEHEGGDSIDEDSLRRDLTERIASALTPSLAPAPVEQAADAASTEILKRLEERGHVLKHSVHGHAPVMAQLEMTHIIEAHFQSLATENKDSDALAEKLRRCEANAAKFELAVCEFAHGLEGNEGDDDPLTVIRFYVDDLRTRLAALQQQVGEADKYSPDGVLHRMVAWFDYYFAKDGRTGPEPESHYAIYHDAKRALNNHRLARQPDQKTTLSPSV